MRNKRFLLVCFILLQSLSLFSQHTKVGLTLSGGGAKGLAHIGILQAIDSAQLNIDYITGTSMGSVIGGLYAAGYSGDSIAFISKNADWENLLSNRILMSDISMEEKEEFGKYAVELPFIKRKIKIASGLIDGQSLWLKFSELFYPTYNAKKFSDLNIPFKCIATDVSTGNAVVLDSGEISYAIRASMSIPSVFTPVESYGTKLIDGGVVRNFPVNDVVEMGADFVIGSNVTQGLRKADQLNTAIDILYQIGFYKDADVFQSQKNRCNIYVQPDLSNFNVSSFDDADSIISKGRQAGDLIYPQLKKLADELRAKDPNYTYKKNRLTTVDSIVIDDISVYGLQYTTKSFFAGRVSLQTDQGLTYNDLSDAVRRVIGTRQYKKVIYRLDPTEPGHANLVFNVKENALTYLKGALHYNSFTGISAIVNLTAYKFPFDRARSIIKLDLSENPRFYAEYRQFLDYKQHWAFTVSTYNDRIDFPIYNGSGLDGLYRLKSNKFEFSFNRFYSKGFEYGIKSRIQDMMARSKIITSQNVEAYNSFASLSTYLEVNTLNKPYFATSGIQLKSSAEYFFNVHAESIERINDQEVDVPQEFLPSNDYQQINFDFKGNVELKKGVALVSQFQAGITFNSDNNFINFYTVGGMSPVIRNQIQFTGFVAGQTTTKTIAVGRIAIQYEFLKNIYITPRANIGLIDFDKFNAQLLTLKNVISGYGLTFGYASAIGPLEVTVGYNDQTKKVQSYVSLGFPFF